jgi:hypothetical protein
MITEFLEELIWRAAWAGPTIKEIVVFREENAVRKAKIIKKEKSAIAVDSHIKVREFDYRATISRASDYVGVDTNLKEHLPDQIAEILEPIRRRQKTR